MCPAARKSANRGLPVNLHTHPTKGWRWMHPTERHYYYFGKDCNRAKAIQTAKALNLKYAPKTDIFDKITSSASQSLRALIELHQREVLAARELAPSTLKHYRGYLRTIADRIGDWDVAAVTTKDVADFLRDSSPGNSQRQKYRQTLIDLFRTSVEQGWRENNPAEATRKPETRRMRQRLTKQQFDAVYERAPQFLRNAMDLGLITLQRRDDVVSLKWESVSDTELRIEQHKTGKRLAIKLDARLRALLDRCRDGITSPFVIHRLPDKLKARDQRAKARTHHTQVLPEMITRAFERARDEAGITDATPAGELPPTFHEIRSLGGDLYRQAGKPETWIQSLMGHEDVDMTRAYLNGHARPWEAVSCDLASVP